MRKTKMIYLPLAIVFLITGIVFLIISATRNLSTFNSLYTMLSGFTQLRYYELFLMLAISSFICFILLIIIWAISKFTIINTKITTISAIIIIILFLAITIFNGINVYKNYSEKGIYTDITQESYQKPDDIYSDYFPYTDSIIKSTGAIPYYSLQEYELNNSVLKTSQMYSDIANENMKNITITIDYFESNKEYMMSKYNAEKYLYETADESGNTITSENIHNKAYKNYHYAVIILKTEKRFIMKDSNFYFSVIVQEDTDSLKINEKEFVDFSLKQFELFKTGDIPPCV